jgi:hypothetical protein
MAVVIVLFGFAVGGFVRLRAGALRWGWLAFALLLAARAVVSMPDQLDRADAALEYGRAEAGALDQLDHLLGEPRAVVALRTCQVIGTSSYRIVPYAAVALDRPPGDLPSLRPGQAGASAAWIAPRSDRAAAFTALGRAAPPPRPPAGFREATVNDDWALYVRGC